jgi:hypothetical protein
MGGVFYGKEGRNMMCNVNERFVRSKTKSFVILLIGLLIVGGVWAVRVAYATIPDSGGVIHACYDTGKGKLRVIDTEAGATCRAQEVALSWNQTGPRGPSDGYVASLRGGPGIRVDDVANVLSLSLPAGDYMLSASALVQRDRAGTSNVVCDFKVGGGPFSTGYVESLDGVATAATIAATSGVSLSADEMVYLTCFSIGDEGSLVTLADLTAIRVGTVTRQ